MAEPRKRKGYRKAGRPTMKDVRNLKNAKALLESATAKEAYKMTHPKCNDSSATQQAHRMITPEVLEIMRGLITMDQPLAIDKETMTKLFMLVVARWMQGNEKTTDFLRALESLKQLAPEFVDRKEISKY